MMGSQKKLIYLNWIAGVLLWSSGIFIFSLSNAKAASDSSWGSRPSWAATTGDSSYSTSPRQRTLREDRGGSYRVKAPMSPGSNNLALSVGQVFLMGDLATRYTDNIGMDAAYTYGVSDIFGFDGSLGMSKHGNDSQFSMTTLRAGFRTNLSWYDRVIPYASLGMGFYKTTYQLTNDYSISPVLFGLYLGPGVDLVLSDRMFFGAALTFHDIFNSVRTTEVGPRDVGGSYSSFFLKLGVSL